MKAAGAAAVLAVAGLSVVLLGADGDSEGPADAGEIRTLAPATASASPDGDPVPEISAKAVTAAPKPTATTAGPTPAPTRSKTAPSAPAAPPATSSPSAAPTTSEPPAPVVPGVVGLTVDQAVAALAAAGYGHEVICQNGFPTDRVASQQPAAGQQWSPGGRVALFVPQGRCRSDRPDRPWGDDD